VIDERNIQRIIKHLEDEAAQKRVLHNIQRGHNEVTVTIGRAASLFGFSESQLRDWEKIGLIKPIRPKDASDSDGTKRSSHGGQRQYSFSELDKLAIIRELLDEAKLTPGSIPPDIDKIWSSIVEKHAAQKNDISYSPYTSSTKSEPIDRRITSSYRDELSWRFYASNALMLSILLLYEAVPGSYAGLILPAYERDGEAPAPEQLPEIGDALVGWLGQTRTFYTFMTPEPSFEYPSDFRILPICPPELQELTSSASIADRTFLVVQRDDIRHVTNTEKAVQTVRRLLTPLYEDRQYWPLYFGEGMRDLVNPGIDFTPRVPDAVLTGLTEMVIRLGGKKPDGTNRWQSCYILLPDNLRLPLQQRSLVVRATSEGYSRLLGMHMATPERYGTSLSLRAYQGGHIMYRSELAPEDRTNTYRELEGPIRSNIALPIGGEVAEPLGVLHAASHDTDAFDEDDQRVLRVMARIIADLLNIYRSRQQITASLADLLEDPGTVDAAFKDFSSENEFLQDIEALLSPIKEQLEAGQLTHHSASTAPTMTTDPDEPQLGEVSFIGVDLDLQVQETIANSYGDQTLARLNKALGLRIRDLLPALFMNYASYKLYHIYAGRYYLLLRDLSLEKTKTSAERLRKGLAASPITIKQPDLPSSSLTLPDIFVHIGVTWYPNEKLAEFLGPIQTPSLANVSSTFYRSLDLVLKLGADSGGNIVFAWDPITRTYAPYQPSDDELNKD